MYCIRYNTHCPNHKPNSQFYNEENSVNEYRDPTFKDTDFCSVDLGRFFGVGDEIIGDGFKHRMILKSKPAKRNNCV